MTESLLSKSLFLKAILISFMMIASWQGKTQRTIHQLLSGWKFILNDHILYSNSSYNDSLWTSLTIPHDWSFEKGVREGGDQGQGGGYHDGGIGWYRKTFKIDEEGLSNTFYLNFDGVYMNSEVWVNGYHLGKRPYGYISFRYNISPYIHEGNNVIAVRVDNSQEPSARWYHPCGIYAPVSVWEVSPTHIAPNGVFVTTPVIKEGMAEVSVKVEVVGSTIDASIKVTVLSDEGEVLAQKSNPLTGEKNIELSLQVTNPQLWSPDSPSLNEVITEVVRSEVALDRVATRIGFRTIDWQTETGFWLNGENIKLKGVCEHWEGGPVGGAWTKPMLRWKLETLKEMGVNAIRPSHNPTPPMFYDICDEIGLLVMDEIFDGWHKKAPMDYGAQAFDDWWKVDITEWIKRDRNHPSVFIYSLGNETHSDIASQLVSFGKSLDTTRLFTSGSGNTEDMEVAGINGGSENQSFIENTRFDKPFISTEAPHTWQTRGYYRTQTWWRDNELPGTYPLPDLTDAEIFFYEGIDPMDWKNRKQRFNSSYDNATVRISARKNWEIMRDTPWHSGHFRWTGFDYYGEAGLVHGGLPFNLFMGGVVDVAGFRKDHFYFYQSQWTEETMLHMLPHWTHPRMEEGTEVPVWVYSNADSVELILNGRSLGIDHPGTRWDEMQCDWLVPYEPGKIEAIAYQAGDQVERTAFYTSGAPSQLNTSIIKLPAEGGFPTSYIVTSEGQDASGNLFPYAENRVYYALDGDVEKVSIENGNPIDPTSRTKVDYRSMFFGKVRLFLEERSGARNASIITASILGDKALYVSDQITIVAKRMAILGELESGMLTIKYTVDGSSPEQNGQEYQGPFSVADGTAVRVIVMLNDAVVLRMEERFGADEGLFWGDEHSTDRWIGRGVNIGAEDATLAGDVVVSTDALRYRGTGFVKFDSNEGAITWYQENDGEAGDYSIRFRYMHNNPGQLHPMKLFVNGEYIKTFEFEPTGGWQRDWRFVVTIVNFRSGANEIRLETTGQSGPYIDELFVD